MNKMAKTTLKEFLEEHGSLEAYVRGRLYIPEYMNARNLALDDPGKWILFAFDWGISRPPSGLTWTELNEKWGLWWRSIDRPWTLGSPF